MNVNELQSIHLPFPSIEPTAMAGRDRQQQQVQTMTDPTIQDPCSQISQRQDTLTRGS
jgi:hypothetical protein